MSKYNFGEKEKEYDIKTGNEIPVLQTPKYKTSKDKAIEMIESKKYELSESDFWILMNRTKSGEKMLYTGLILSHNGCLKINDKLDNKVNPKCFTLDKEGYKNSLVYTYVDEDTFEVGEFNADNGKNIYPYAMAFKRCFDRVVLKKSKLAFSGIYSEGEPVDIEEDNSPYPINSKPALNDLATLEQLIIENDIDREGIYKKYGVESTAELKPTQLIDAIKAIEDWKTKKEGK